HFVFEAESRDDFVHAWAAMRAAGSQTHLGEGFLVGDFCLFGLELRTLDPCSASMHRAIEHTGQWLIDHAESTHAVLGESDLDREIAVAVDEAVCAVEWIDHPDARLFETAFCVDRFFGEDAVVGKLAFETVDDQLVSDRVSLRDW